MYVIRNVHGKENEKKRELNLAKKSLDRESLRKNIVGDYRIN